MNKQELLNLYLQTKATTSNYFDLPESQLNLTYGPGKWNIRQVLHHLADAECVFVERLRRIVAEPKRVIWKFMQEDWDKAFQYVNEPLTGRKELYNVCRDQNLWLVEKYFDSHGAREFVHSETGLGTFAFEAERLATHNVKHIGHIELALSKS